MNRMTLITTSLIVVFSAAWSMTAHAQMETKPAHVAGEVKKYKGNRVSMSPIAKECYVGNEDLTKYKERIAKNLADQGLPQKQDALGTFVLHVYAKPYGGVLKEKCFVRVAFLLQTNLQFDQLKVSDTAPNKQAVSAMLRMVKTYPIFVYASDWLYSNPRSGAGHSVIGVIDRLMGDFFKNK